MGSLAIQRLESLLQTRRLDSTVHRLPIDRPVLPTGVAAVDRAIGGGWPGGEISELAGSRSTGRTAVLLASLAAATTRGGIVGLVDAFDRLDPISAAAAGVDLDRVLWVRGPSMTLEHLQSARRSIRGAAPPVDTAIQHAIRAFDLIVRAGGFAVAVLDLADVHPACLNTLPFTTWLRLAHANEGRDTVGLIAADAPVGRSARGVSLRLEATRCWTGAHARQRRFAGFDIQAYAAGGHVPHEPADGARRHVRGIGVA